MGPPGFHTTAREPRRAHLRVLVFKTPPKFDEKTPEREEKNEILRREKEKKARNFGRSRGRAVQAEGGPAEGGKAEGGPAEGGPAEGGPAEGGPAEGGPAEGGPAEGGPNQGRSEPGGGGFRWPKLAWPDQNRAGHPKSTRPWPKSAKATRVAKVGRNWFRLHNGPNRASLRLSPKSGRLVAKVGLVKVGHSQQNQGKTAQTTTQKQ